MMGVSREFSFTSSCRFKVFGLDGSITYEEPGFLL